jgi:hypothetical protein
MTKQDESIANIAAAAAAGLRRRRGGKPSPMAERSNLEILLDRNISFDAACSIVADRWMRGNPAAQSTIDALMYSFRSSTTVLSRPDVQRRLAMLDERQMRNCCALLQNRNVAKSWTANEAEMFVIVWARCHG